MNYKLIVYPVETTDGIEWIAKYPELEFCLGGGKTIEEAVICAEKNKVTYLKEMKRYSGNKYLCDLAKAAEGIMDTKCVCGRELEHGKSLCYVCEALVLSQKDCDRYLKLKEGKRVKNINDIKDRRQNHNQSK